ncbi:MAG: PHP domain-containing protein [Clostridia bacterium]|nr:PHP domain-containing protein [Clostridia bacterium]
MSYKYELHCHTGEVSTCATAPATQTVEKYKNAGYDGIVITDHFSGLTFPPYSYFNYKKNAERYLSGYKAALDAAGDDFTVLLGMEIRFLFTPNDYLVYGIDEDFVRNSGNFLLDNQKTLYEKVKSAGAVLVQAHPFRGYVRRAKPRFLDGVEVHNGKTKNPIENEKSLLWARGEGLEILTSGSDYHHPDSKISGGIETKEKIKTNSDLLRILRSGEYTLIKE